MRFPSNSSHDSNYVKLISPNNKLIENRMQSFEDGEDQHPITNSSFTTFDEMYVKAGGFSRYQYDILLISASLHACFGIEIVTPVVLTPRVTEIWRLSKIQGDLFSSALFFGFCLGMLTIAPFSDKHGRRPVVLICCLGSFLAYVCSFLASGYITLACLRMIAGFFMGGSFNANIVLIIELSVAESRAFVKGILSVSWAFGLAYFFVAARLLEALSWRFLWIAITPMLFLIGVAILKFPESPRYLYLMGRKKELYLVMAHISEVNQADFVNEEQFFTSPLISEEVAPTQHGKWNMLEIFSPAVRNNALAVAFVQFSCNLAYYGILLFSPPLSSETNLYLDNILASLLEIPVVMTMSPLANYFGRKKTQAGYFIFSSLGLFALTYVNPTQRNLYLICTLIIRLATSGSTTLCYVIAAESFPTSMRNFGVSWGNFCGKVAATLSQPLVDNTSYALQLTGFLGVAAIFVLASIPEGAGKDLKNTAEDMNITESEQN